MVGTLTKLPDIQLLVDYRLLQVGQGRMGPPANCLDKMRRRSGTKLTNGRAGYRLSVTSSDPDIISIRM